MYTSPIPFPPLAIDLLLLPICSVADVIEPVDEWRVHETSNREKRSQGQGKHHSEKASAKSATKENEGRKCDCRGRKTGSNTDRHSETGAEISHSRDTYKSSDRCVAVSHAIYGVFCLYR